jgi:hypothetical protein
MKFGVIRSGLLMAGVGFLSACSDDMQLLNDERLLYGGCHNVYQMMVKGQPQPMVRADAVFTTEAKGQHYLTMTKGEDGIEVDITRCDSDALAMFDQPLDAMEGPAGRVVGKLIR